MTKNKTKIIPYIFIEGMAPDKYDEKIRILKELLILDVTLLTRTYELILEELNTEEYPILECDNCNHCVVHKDDCWLEYNCK